MPSEGEQQPWHSAFPTPSFNSKRITANELVAIMKEKVAGKEYIVVDVRRADFEVRVQNSGNTRQTDLGP